MCSGGAARDAANDRVGSPLLRFTVRLWRPIDEFKVGRSTYCPDQIRALRRGSRVAPSVKNRARGSPGSCAACGMGLPIDACSIAF